MVHGLTKNADSCASLVAAFQKSFGNQQDNVITIHPKCGEGFKSI